MKRWIHASIDSAQVADLVQKLKDVFSETTGQSGQCHVPKYSDYGVMLTNTNFTEEEAAAAKDRLDSALKKTGLNAYVYKTIINAPVPATKLFYVLMYVNEPVGAALDNKASNSTSPRSEAVSRRFRYVVYDCDLGDNEELDALKSFPGTRKEAAIRFAEKYAKEHANEGLGAHVVIIPDDEDDEEVLEYFEYSLGGVEPYEVVWSSY